MLSVSSRYIFRVPYNIRAASTRAAPRGLGAILQQNPDDVVITFAKRTAVGRAKKGQLKDIPIDEMLQALFKVSHSQYHCNTESNNLQATLERTKLDPSKIDDICVGGIPSFFKVEVF
jgi:acetyl-CoA acyltransferase 1